MKSRYVVVTPARDEEETLPHTIDSMRAQQIPPARWIIVDDGSTDGTLEIARRAEQGLPWLEVMSRGDRGHRALGGGAVEGRHPRLPWLRNSTREPCAGPGLQVKPGMDRAGR